jgi:hypothetical protein
LREGSEEEEGVRVGSDEGEEGVREGVMRE